MNTPLSLQEKAVLVALRDGPKSIYTEAHGEALRSLQRRGFIWELGGVWTLTGAGHQVAEVCAGGQAR